MVKFAQLPKYEAYKDSGEGWIAEVPAHWDVRKLKHLFFEKKHTKNMSLNSGAISFGKVVTKDDDKILQSTKASYQEVLTGEFLINPLNLNYDLISLRIALSEINVVVSAGYIVIKEKEQISKKYFKYFLHMYDISYMKLLGSGVRQTISFNHISDSLLLYPPLEEQTLIANFLDQKTTQIDAAIAIKEQQIELLKERKQIIIQQAVTQGLAPNVPMKDSGVDWIGKVPAHWEVKRIKHVGKIINGYAFPSDAFIQEGARVMKISNIQTMRLDWSDSSYVDALWLDKTAQFRIYKGDLVFALTRPVISTGIKAALVDTDEPILLNQRNAVFRPNDTCDKNWIYFVLLTKGFINDFEMQIDITGQQPNISTVAIGNLPFPLPPELEQKVIVSDLSRRCALLDMAVDDQIAQIERLKEYKTTLINSAVTGKIKITPEMLQA